MKRTEASIWRPYLDSLLEDGSSHAKRLKPFDPEDEIWTINKFFNTYDTDGKFNYPSYLNDVRAPLVRRCEFQSINSYTVSESSNISSSSLSNDSRSSSPTMSRNAPSMSRSSSYENIYPPFAGHDKELDDNEGDGQQRRTKFTENQLYELNRVFYAQTYLNLQQRHDLAKKLHLKESQIKNWFQNRRMKAKRDYMLAINRGFIIPIQNPGLPKFSRMPKNYFLSYPIKPYLNKCWQNNHTNIGIRLTY